MTTERVPAHEMLPTPFIVEDLGTYSVPPEVEKLRIGILKAEIALMGEGIPQGDLSVGRLVVQHVESSREMTTDSLTGLLNRKGMDMWYERYCPEVFGVIFADGRNFKRVNDTYGHDTGDEVIRTIGHEISEKFRISKPGKSRQEKRTNPNSRDAMGIVHWGGDEFLMVVNLTDVEEAERENVLKMLQERLYNFGTVIDSLTGDKINIEIDSAATIGYRADGKSLKDYREKLDAEVSQIKKQRGYSR